MTPSRRHFLLLIGLLEATLAHAQPLEPTQPLPPLSIHFLDGVLMAYGNLDVSVDAATKGIAGLRDANGQGPVGNVGWLPDLSTNLSYLGVRGFYGLGSSGWQFVFQLETQVDIAASSGTSETNSNSSDVVKGGLTSRNSFVGLASFWGTIMAGKTDAPYKLSTARMNPFYAMIGDYQVIMGNTGGDNRVEFGTRLDHSLWYESPTLSGFSLALLYSPGQNRAEDSSNLAAGESDCTGGNIPGSGGTGGPATGFPISCNDGAFSDAVSGSLSYQRGPVYAVVAYERHRRVNRNSDIYGIYGVYPLPAGVTGYDAADVADEDAAKVGVQVVLPTQTTVSGIFENLHRYVPQFLEFQNERQRWGTWLAVSQQLTPVDSVHVGWAYASRTPGDPGQHNTATEPVGNGGFAGGANVNNSANLLTAAFKHRLARNLTLYVAWALTLNAPYAHYDLGAGGRAVTTDCHDASLPASGDVNADPHCWAGGRLMGASVGLSQQF